MKITKLLLHKLKPHEKTSLKRLAKLKKQILAKKFIANPVIVEKDNLIILDGHHRTQALKDLGYKKVPAFLVDYSDNEIAVVSRRKNVKISKDTIVKRALEGKIYPYKTSKHIIFNKPKDVNTPLNELK